MAYKKKRMLRAIIVLCCLVVLSSAVGITALVPAFLRAQDAVDSAEVRLRATEDTAVANVREARSLQALLVRKQVEALNASYDEDIFSRVYSALAIVSATAGDIHITRISYGLVNGKTALTLAGTARTREALDSFGRALKKDPLTKNADVPASLFADKSGIDFSIPIMKDDQLPKK